MGIYMGKPPIQEGFKEIYHGELKEKQRRVNLLTTTVDRDSTATLFTADNSGLCNLSGLLYSITTGKHAYARIYKNGTMIFEYDNNMKSGNTSFSTSFNVEVGDVISAQSYCQFYSNNINSLVVYQNVLLNDPIKAVYKGSETILQNNVELLTTSVPWNTTATLFTVTKSGVYHFKAILHSEHTSTQGRIFKNGIQVFRYYDNNNTGNFNVCWTFYAEQGDVISAQPYSNYTANFNSIEITQDIDSVGGDMLRPNYFHIKANTAGSKVRLVKFNSPTAINIEYSTNLISWYDYTIYDYKLDDTYGYITLANKGDIIYFRNKNENGTTFSTSDQAYYFFQATGSISAGGNITTLIATNGTKTLSNYCFSYLFSKCSSLVEGPKIPNLPLVEGCYYSMFSGTSLITLPTLYPYTIPKWCYTYMFRNCRALSLSETQTDGYNIPYTIPGNTSDTSSVSSMFYETGGTFTGTPTTNKTYYTMNKVI